MNQSEFEAELQGEGYQVFYGGAAAGKFNPEHSHEFDARVMVIGGDITITRGGVSQTFHAGDACSVPAGELHIEQIGPQGVAFIAGRRTVTAP